jgi:predicted histidine transporter YuiF (NhaC family)
MDWITAPLICAVIFGCIYKVVELFVHKRERLMLINKLTEISNVDFKGISLYNSGNKFTGLRIGWLMLGVGFGFLFGFLINLMATNGRYATEFSNAWSYHHYVGGIAYVACICICGGIGLLLSYRAERNAEQPKEKKADEFQI